MAVASPKIRALLLVAVVTTSVVAAVAAVPTTADATTSASISASPGSAGTSSVHRAAATVGSCEAGDSLNKLRVDYAVGSNPADVSSVDQTDVQAVGIDTNGDGTIDTDVSSDLSSVSASNDGHTLDVGFGGSYSLTAGDTVVIEFADAVNPDAGGTYDVNVSVNFQSDPVCPSTTSLTVDETAATAIVSATPSTAGERATHTVERTVGSANQGVALETVSVEYAATDASGLSTSDVTTVGLDTTGDGSVDTDLSTSLTSVDVSSGSTVTFSFDGSRTLDAGDVLVLTYDGVSNPSAGEYTVSTDLAGTGADATLAVSASTERSVSVSANPTTVNRSAVHTASIRVGDDDVGDSLNKFRVDYTEGASPADVSEVGDDDVEAVGIDTDGDGTIDTNVADDLSSVSVSNDGHTLDVGFGGSYSLTEGDVVLVEFGNVTNPETSGTFDVAVSVNFQSDPVTREVDTVSYTSGDTDETPTDDTTEESTERGLDTLSTSAIEAVPPTAGTPDATHVVRATLSTHDEATVQSLTVDYTAGVDPADVGTFNRTHVEVVGVDTDGDGTSERSVADTLGTVDVTNQGETVRFTFDGTASVSDGDTLVLRYESVQNPAAVGSFDVGVTVQGSQRSVEAETAVAVESWNGAGTSDTRSETTVAVSDDGEDTTAVVQNAYGGRPVEMDLGGRTAGDGVSVDSASLTFAERTNATFVVDQDVEEPLSIVGPTLGHFSIRHGTANLSSVNVTFDVPKRALTTADVDPDQVVLARQTADGEWTELETHVTDDGAAAYRYEASATSLSTFAVTARPVTTDSEPVFVVGETDTSVEPQNSSKRVRVTATVRNVGTENGTFDARFTSNGAVLATRTVSVDSGGSATVTFEQTFSEPAVYDVGVSGADAGAIEVDATEPDKPTAPERPGQPGVPPVLLGLLGAVGVSGLGSWFVATR